MVALPQILGGLAAAAQAVRDVNEGVSMVGGFASEVKQLGETIRSIGRVAADPGGAAYDLTSWAVRHSVGGAFAERRLEMAAETATAVAGAYGQEETVERTTQAFQRLQGAARNLWQGFQGIITAGAKFVGAVGSWSEQAVESQSSLAVYSGEMAESMAQLRVGRLQRDIQFAQETGTSFAVLSENRQRFEEAMQPGRQAIQEMENRLLSGLLAIGTNLLEIGNRTVVPVLETVNDFLEWIRWRDEPTGTTKMFDDIMDGVEKHHRAREMRERKRRTI